MAGVLEGIRVIDFGQHPAPAMSAMLLTTTLRTSRWIKESGIKLD